MVLLIAAVVGLSGLLALLLFSGIFSGPTAPAEPTKPTLTPATQKADQPAAAPATVSTSTETK